MDIETNDVLATCKELQIPVVAYSPLGRGFLTGQIRKLDDLPEGDNRRHLDRFQVQEKLCISFSSDNLDRSLVTSKPT
jgi:aryl-alcohol dehydrogenase-like predicted oxidoreductase